MRTMLVVAASELFDQDLGLGAVCKLRISLIVNAPIGDRERNGATLVGSVFLERSLPSRRPL